MRVARDSAEKFLARITPFVERDGARNMLDISSKLDIPYQTVRFRLGRLMEQGISISPFVDVQGLGLRRYRISFDFRSEDEAKEVAPFLVACIKQQDCIIMLDLLSRMILTLNSWYLRVRKENFTSF